MNLPQILAKAKKQGYARSETIDNNKNGNMAKIGKAIMM